MTEPNDWPILKIRNPHSPVAADSCIELDGKPLWSVREIDIHIGPDDITTATLVIECRVDVEMPCEIIELPGSIPDPGDG